MNWMITPNFDDIHPKIIEITISFHEFAPAYENEFIPSTHSSPVARLATPISDHVHPKIFWSTFNLCEFVLTCGKSDYLLDLFWRYGWLRNPAIWLAENILGHISVIKISQIWDLCRNTTNRSNLIKINDQNFQ